VNRTTPFSIALSPMNRQRCAISTPGAFASTMNAVICLRGFPLTTTSGCARHDDEQVGARAVGAPQLLAVQRPRLPVLAARRARAEIGRIGAGVDLGERERGDRALGEPREVALLLLGRAEQLQRLRQSDGLVRRQQRGERAVLARHHRDRARVARVRESHAAVLGRDLDAERAHLAQLLHVRLGDVARPVDHVGVDALEEVAQLREELRGARLLGGILDDRMRMDEIEAEAAEEQLADEARSRPLALTRAASATSRAFLLGSETCGGRVLLGHGTLGVKWRKS
jgi:hypothetical protein